MSINIAIVEDNDEIRRGSDIGAFSFVPHFEWYKTKNPVQTNGVEGKNC